ncbi:hypothetical protein [Novosphingobium album (ex Liu et al. 2023)]|uniref:VanZ family protein n=1 Tax=Novosphingobium album (ex Liu et al. 2023) TaxID=3031130 RepID=A0ABT5WTA4_9SPHN|nr:hypothetical protein [Novosphingobium album (ex Liu et al. 2023)]MDE8652543.1 hypothetical protein [Novosphingobium album (ex Liu et al. 2023)]
MSGTSSNRVLKSVLFWLVLSAILILALLPHPPAVPVESDKVQHMIAFATLSLLARLAFPRRSLAALFVTMAALGAAIEVLQMIPALHRDAELADWLADCVASLTVLVLFRGMQWILSPKHDVPGDG